jgi:AraC family transcriptional regulator
VTYGLIGNFDDASGEFDYMAGVEVSHSTGIPEDMDKWEVPEQEYAVFACELPNLIETLDLAYKTWLPESDFRRGDGPEFEYYGAEFDPEDPCSIMHVYIPVE